jgi:hypothetical protein
MTREERTARIRALTRVLSMLLAEEAPRPVMRLVSGNEMPPWVKAWLLEQIQRASKEENPALH